MKKIFKFLLKIVAALVILFFIASILISNFVDINQYKGEIAELVEQESGLQLKINGDMKLTIFSGLKFNAEKVKLFLGDELIANINSLHIGMDPYSLYIGEPEIDSVELDVKTLKMFRDKNGQFNFLPLYKNKTDSQKGAVSVQDKLALNYLALKNIQLSIEQFQYLDDLESVSVKLNSVNASLSLLPIIDHHELVIDDPRVLVDYTYSGELDIKQALINQFQIADLSMSFKDQKGDFIADKLAFNFIQEGAEHAAPPLMFDAKGKLSFKLRYHVPEGASEPLWSRPDIIKVGKIDFSLPKLKLSKKEFQLEISQAQVMLEEVAIFETSKYALDDLQIKSLNFDGKTIDVKLKNKEEYHFNQFVLQLSNLPVIHKGKYIDIMSETFLRKFSQKGRVKFSSDSFSNQYQELQKINMALEGKNNKIALANLSFYAMDSKVNSKGHFLFNKKDQKGAAEWQLKIHSDKLNLKPLFSLLNLPVEIKGYAAIDTNLSGAYKDSDFSVISGTVKTKANNLLVSGIDVNRLLNDFQNSQSVGLLDVGAVALLGPAGVLVTKGNDYNTLVNTLGSKGTSKIRQLNSEISYSDDIATMHDVAFSTDKYRLAVKGKVNIDKNTFINFKLATIDKDGCPVYEEEVTGSLNSPTVKKVNILVSGVVNPISSLVSKIKKPLNIKCKEPFYDGVVKAPLK
ncbi:MAG: AsmA family protein [Gammaproteobacteria bacterium]|nr:AsmA family protein [Gammaproteobacteria bacterium]